MILDRLFEARASLKAAPRWLLDAWGGVTTAAGTSVSHETALRHPAVYRAVSLISTTVGQLPLKIYRRLPDDGKLPEPAHRLYPLLHDSPNSEMTAQDFREALQADLCLYGNAFAEVTRDGQGRITALWPLASSRMTISRTKDLQLKYLYQVDGQRFEYLFDPIRPPLLHLRAFSADGLVGRSPIQICRESIGAAVAADDYGARFFGNGAAPAGVLTGPRNARLTEQAHQRLRSSWEAAHRGVAQAHRVAVLEDGWTWNPIAVANRDSQWIESRKHAVLDVARIFGLPPFLLFDMEQSANYSNVEQQGLDFLREIGGWLKRWEMQINKDLLSIRSSRTHFSKFVIEGLLRGDIQTRYASYAQGRQWGWLSINDVRRLEDLNPIGVAGDDYMQPLNMAAAGSMPPPPVIAGDDSVSEIQAARLFALATGDPH